MAKKTARIPHPEPCIACSGLTDGYKCELCGFESPTYNGDHACGGAHLMPKCAECGEPESACSC